MSTKHAPQPNDAAIAVAIVEDDADLREIIEDWLGAHRGFRCVGSYDSAEAALAQNPFRKPALIIVDLGLPGLNGIEFISRQKAKDPDVKMIVLTGNPEEDVILEAMDAGADGFLHKPISRSELIAQLEEVFREGHPLSERARKFVVERYRKFTPACFLMSMLTEREKEIAKLDCQGIDNEAIARKLGVSRATIRTHQEHIHKKLEVHNRAELQVKLLGLNRSEIVPVCK